ncbi:NAD(+)/NADH kinase [Williamsoniiplasma lucivorax]|uniref:NAD kinase n=1 Tax=Williamsoniiplasma lucivorax TaxID=209274 RepID=A0A2S5RF55_9MOLU|nr:NAD(+)/NADH kinase [Williamsoniiplasma lucivorax]PPE05765.1 inorganic polyphosphate/ATP-NAD kinase [Williamsoniiplasma lucivorax]
MKYSILTNRYQESKDMEREILAIVADQPDFIQDDVNPNYVFVIGGDGTFLSAVHKFSQILGQVIFIPIKFGGIGFYTSHNTVDDFKKLFASGIEKNQKWVEYSLLKVTNKQSIWYSINEVKIVDNTRPTKMDVFINDELLETFRGTGMVFATPSGSSGFAKSAHGSVIFPNTNLFEMVELFPVSTNKFRTLNAPIIFDHNQVITLNLKDITNITLAVDTANYPLTDPQVEVRLSDKKIKIMSLSQVRTSKTKILNDIFVLNNNTKDN